MCRYIVDEVIELLDEEKEKMDRNLKENWEGFKKVKEEEWDDEVLARRMAQ